MRSESDIAGDANGGLVSVSRETYVDTEAAHQLRVSSNRQLLESKKIHSLLETSCRNLDAGRNISHLRSLSINVGIPPRQINNFLELVQEPVAII